MIVCTLLRCGNGNSRGSHTGKRVLCRSVHIAGNTCGLLWQRRIHIEKLKIVFDFRQHRQISGQFYRLRPASTAVDIVGRQVFQLRLKRPSSGSNCKVFGSTQADGVAATKVATGSCAAIAAACKLATTGVLTAACQTGRCGSGPTQDVGNGVKRVEIGCAGGKLSGFTLKPCSLPMRAVGGITLSRTTGRGLIGRMVRLTGESVLAKFANTSSSAMTSVSASGISSGGR
jgi:hypothetical protein